jgi:HB1, ASXL, restriction endonuclease HTH domain
MHMSKSKKTAAKNKKPAKAAKAKKASGPKKLSAINAAAQVLADAKDPMTCQELIEAMEKKELWTSPGGKTPAATLYSAILREIQNRGADSRFKKTERGKFAAK